MSRLIRQAGPRVGRFGRSVSTRYGLTHEIPGLGRHVPVFRVDERGHPNRHGVLRFLAGGAYWFERESRRILSPAPRFVVVTIPSANPDF